MSEKSANFGRKAKDMGQSLDPNDYVRGEREAIPGGAAAKDDQATKSAPEGQGDESKAKETLVRITVDVPKSVHKKLQKLSADRETKIAPLIRGLIDKELRRSKEAQ